jgi:heptaprenyl diphosphate synthase
MKNSIAKRTAYYGMFVALAFVFSYIEVLIPFSIGIPGIKLGLANIVVLTILYAMGTKEAFVISCIRILLVGFTFGNMSSILFSFAGGLLSWLVMSICKQIKSFSMIGVSIAGGITHNIGQILVAAIILETASIALYIPVLLIVGTVTGLVIGLLGAGLLKVQKKIFNT